MPFREGADPDGMRAALLAMGVAAFLCPAGTAAASLLPPLPSPPTLPPPPDLTGTIGDLLGTLGEAGTPGAGAVPPGGSVGESPGPAGAGGGGSGEATPGATTPPSGATGSSGAAATPTAPDTRAPRVKLKVLSSFGWVARTGRLKVRVTSDEPSVVAVRGTLRVRRKVRRLAASVLGYRSARTLTATVRFPRAARPELARARSVRLSLQAIAVDVARNRRTTALEVTLSRPGKLAHLRRARRSGGRWGVDSPR